MSRSFRIVIPAYDRALSLACVRAWEPVADRLVVVDNTGDPTDTGFLTDVGWAPGVVIPGRPGRQWGVAGAWNHGADRVIADGDPDALLVVCSQALVIRDVAGFVAALDQADEWGIEFGTVGWHLIGFTARTLATIGPFDEGFWPAYSEDTDYLYRMGLHDVPSPRENGRFFPRVFGVDMHDHGHGLMVARARPNWTWLDERYRAKWGGPQGAERFRTPWDSGRATWWSPDSPYEESDPWSRTCG